MFDKLVTRAVHKAVTALLPGILATYLSSLVKLDKESTYLLVVPDDATARDVADWLRPHMAEDTGLARRVLLVAADDVRVVEITRK